MKCYKIRKKPEFMTEYDNKYNPEGWWASGKGRDLWHNLGATRGTIKTSYIPYNETIEMYEIVEFEMKEVDIHQFR
jgi:hypothetical protein